MLRLILKTQNAKAAYLGSERDLITSSRGSEKAGAPAAQQVSLSGCLSFLGGSQGSPLVPFLTPESSKDKPKYIKNFKSLYEQNSI